MGRAVSRRRRRRPVNCPFIPIYIFRGRFLVPVPLPPPLVRQARSPRGIMRGGPRGGPRLEKGPNATDDPRAADVIPRKDRFTETPPPPPPSFTFFYRPSPGKMERRKKE